MVRVVYRWRVEPDRQGAFIPWWHAGTLRIRKSQPGALGSTLCRSAEGVFVGIARWLSREHVEDFWKRTGTIGFDGAVLNSIEILEEIDDLTEEHRAPD